ncbi:hypothetical protein [Nonomuraea typhae]|uniref:Uncharacterized protein n=1 Tax=Nonomuraea typhae TaxID=2603600 RepID=A0ABW7Z6V7_9ACTN
MTVSLDRTRVENDSPELVVAPIWLDLDGSPFPEEGWFDFPIPLLTWWLTEVRDLLNGEQDECWLTFMDGPFEARIAREGDAFVVDLTHWEEVTDHFIGVRVDELLTSLEATARSLIAICESRQLGSEVDMAALRAAATG